MNKRETFTPLDLAAIRRIADHVRAIDPDDEGMLADMIEGESDAFEMVDTLLLRIGTLEGYITANKEHIAFLAERNKRFSAGVDAARAAIGKVLEATGLRKIERAEGTVSLRRVPPSLMDGPLPSDARFIRTKAEADKKAIKAAIEAGEHVPGWSLSNGGETISVRRT